MASQIRFEPQGAAGLVAPGTSIAASAERLGVPMELRCGGVGECTSCAVRIADGPFSLSPLTDAERRILSDAEIGSALRLGCQARVGDSDCTIHILDVAERPPMPEHAADTPEPDAATDEAKAGSCGESASKGGSWFGFEPFWNVKWGLSGESEPCGDSPENAEADSAGSDRQPVDDVRRRILEAFGELPASERLAAALEIDMKAATDFFGAVLDGPLKAGEEAFDALMKQAASVVREARKRESEASAPPEPAPDATTSNDQETDRP